MEKHPAFQLADINIKRQTPVLSPAQLYYAHPISVRGQRTVYEARQQIKAALDGNLEKIIITSGPCSIHSIQEAKEYGNLLHGLAQRTQDRFLLIMRVYLEKPRTGADWEGYIMDPARDGTGDMNRGLHDARDLLVYLAELGLPAATEPIWPNNYNRISDLISWACIGARSVGAQTYRKMASGISAPVGLKNPIDGDINIVVKAMEFAVRGNFFPGVDYYGIENITETTGNKYCHLVLRGSNEPNYDRESVANAQLMLKKAGYREAVIIDCSHGNSKKQYKRQSIVFNDVLEQMQSNKHIIGMMLESNLEEGSQKMSDKLLPGVSITDGCIGWNETEELIMKAYESLGNR